jgi:hypothetical protein
MYATIVAFALFHLRCGTMWQFFQKTAERGVKMAVSD